jgi:hypothetical protein
LFDDGLRNPQRQTSLTLSSKLLFFGNAARQANVNLINEF